MLQLFGQVMDVLEESGVSGQTAVVVTGDHVTLELLSSLACCVVLTTNCVPGANIPIS